MAQEPRRTRKTRPTPLRGSGVASAQPHVGPSDAAAQRRRTWNTLLWVILGLSLWYISIGFSPIIPVEGDEAAIANGAARLANLPAVDRNEDLYCYHFQPLPYVILALGERRLGVETLAGFGVWTLLGFASFLGFGSLFCARQTGLPLAAAALVLLLFQESYVGAYYANTSMIAAGLMAPAAVLLTLGTWPAAAGAGILWSLAVVSRFDMLAMGPVLAVVAWNFRRDRMANGAVFVAAAVVGLGLLAYLLGVSPAGLRAEVMHHKTICTNVQWAIDNYRTLLSPFVCLLGAMGVMIWLVRRDWKMLLLSLAGVLPLMLIYGRGVTTPKYLLFAIPFFALPVATALVFLATLPNRPWRLGCFVLLGGLFFQQYFWGLTDGSVVDYLKRSPGNVLWTADSYRMRSSYGLSPAMWNLAKSFGAGQLAAFEKDLQEFVAEVPSGDVVATTGGFWLSQTTLEYLMRRAGFLPPTVAQEPSASTTPPQAPWKAQVYKDRSGWVFKMYFLHEQTPGNRSRDAFLLHQRFLHPVANGTNSPRPYSFLMVQWGTDLKFLERRLQCGRTDCDLSKLGTSR